MTEDSSTSGIRLGYLKAQFWPISVLDEDKGEPPNQKSQNKIYVPRSVLRFSYVRVLYHYTTVEGLFGIVRDNAVWARHVRYLNDVEEVSHGRELSIATLRRLRAKSRLAEFVRVLDETAKILSEAKLPDYYVASFSMVEDDLTQWRAYGRDRGICIGFDFGGPESHLHFYLPVVAIYSMRDKVGLILFLVARYFSEFKKDLAFYGGELPEFLWGRYAQSLADKFLYEFIRFKHESFRSEQEVRQVVSGAEKAKYRPLRHRVRGNLIIPYHRTCDLIWRNKDGSEGEPPKLPIASVMVGPMDNQSLCAASIRDFLAAHGFDRQSVNLSKLPYRAH